MFVFEALSLLLGQRIPNRNDFHELEVKSCDGCLNSLVIYASCEGINWLVVFEDPLGFVALLEPTRNHSCASEWILNVTEKRFSLQKVSVTCLVEVSIRCFESCSHLTYLVVSGSEDWPVEHYFFLDSLHVWTVNEVRFGSSSNHLAVFVRAAISFAL